MIWLIKYMLSFHNLKSFCLLKQTVTDSELSIPVNDNAYASQATKLQENE